MMQPDTRVLDIGTIKSNSWQLMFGTSKLVKEFNNSIIIPEKKLIKISEKNNKDLHITCNPEKRGNIDNHIMCDNDLKKKIKTWLNNY